MDKQTTVNADEIASQRLRVFRFILKSVGRVSDAEDLAQRTLLTALETKHRFDGSSSLTTWLFGIALNHIRVHRRFRRREAGMEGEDALALIADDGDDPSVSLARRRDRSRLAHAIIRLPDPLREVIALVSLEDFSYEAAAAALGIPVGTVRSRLHRAKRILRGQMSENESRGGDIDGLRAGTRSVAA